MFVKEGEVLQKERVKQVDTYLFLFSDSLLITKRVKVKEQHKFEDLNFIILEGASVRVASLDPLAFQLQFKMMGLSYWFTAPNLAERDDWVRRLSQSIETASAAHQRNLSSPRRVASPRASANDSLPRRKRSTSLSRGSLGASLKAFSEVDPLTANSAKLALPKTRVKRKSILSPSKDSN